MSEVRTVERNMIPHRVTINWKLRLLNHVQISTGIWLDPRAFAFFLTSARVPTQEGISPDISSTIL